MIKSESPLTNLLGQVTEIILSATWKLAFGILGFSIVNIVLINIAALPGIVIPTALGSLASVGFSLVFALLGDSLDRKRYRKDLIAQRDTNSIE